MNEKVFLHYSQSELDRNYDQRGWIGNVEEIIARYIARSEAARRVLEQRRDTGLRHAETELKNALQRPPPETRRSGAEDCKIAGQRLSLEPSST